MSLFPKDDKARKSLPVFAMITRYFPKALREITRVCVANNVRYNPDREPADINWARGKSPDQLGSAFRHLMENAVDGTVFEDVPPEIAAIVQFDTVYVLAEAAWRICAALELEIEAQEGLQSGRQQLYPEITDGKIDCQNPQCATEQNLRAAWTPISNRGQESRSERPEQSFREWIVRGES